MPYPTQGQITQGFGASGATVGSWTESFNKGIDIGARMGTPVYSTVPGRVIYVGDDGAGWGTRVMVQDTYGNVHSYGHLSTTNVKVGDQVYGGSNLGAVGDTGLSTGPHLSYDVRDSEGNYFDPAFIVDASSSEAADQALGKRRPGPEGTDVPQYDPFAGATATAASAPSPGAAAWDAAAAATPSTTPNVTPSGAPAGTSLTGMTRDALRVQLNQSFNAIDQAEKAAADASAAMQSFEVRDERGRLTGYNLSTPEAKAAQLRYQQANAALEAATSRHSRLMEMYQIAGSATEYFDQNIAAIIKLVELGQMPADRAFKEIQLTQQARRDQLNEIKADLDTSAANDARTRQQVQDEMGAWEKYTGGRLDAAREAARLYEQIAPRLVSSSTPMNMSSATDQLLRQRGIDPGAPNIITPTSVNIPDVQGAQQAFLDALMNPPARVQALMSGTNPAPVPYAMPSASLGMTLPTPQLPANQYTDLLTQTLLQYIGRPQPGVVPPAPAGIPDWAMGPSIPSTMPLPGEIR